MMSHDVEVPLIVFACDPFDSSAWRIGKRSAYLPAPLGPLSINPSRSYSIYSTYLHPFATNDHPSSSSHLTVSNYGVSRCRATRNTLPVPSGALLTSRLAIPRLRQLTSMSHRLPPTKLLSLEAQEAVKITSLMISRYVECLQIYEPGSEGPPVRRLCRRGHHRHPDGLCEKGLRYPVSPDKSFEPAESYICERKLMRYPGPSNSLRPPS